MPHPTVKSALFVGGVAVAGELLASRYRRNHPVPTPYRWSLMWEQVTPAERAAMKRWSDRWTYPREGDPARALCQRVAASGILTEQQQAVEDELYRMKCEVFGLDTPGAAPATVTEPADRLGSAEQVTTALPRADRSTISIPEAAVATTRADVFVGIDLAWSTGTTGLAAVDASGRLLTSTSARDDDEIATWLDELPLRPRVVAVDAPLVVPNDTGHRVPERLIGQTFGRYGAHAHSANRTLMGGEPRGMRLARRFGWTVDPHARPSEDRTVCIEVYPHPALIGVFGLPYRLGYKKGSIAARLPEFIALLDHLETIPELHLPTHPRWQQIREAVTARQPGVLGRYEDEVDAIVCAHLAWLWQHRPETLHVYGSLDEGYIVAPPPPTHAAAKPSPAAVAQQTGTPKPERRQPTAQRATRRHSATGRLADDAADVRDLLIHRIALGTAPVTYGEAAAHVGRIANGLGPLLDEVASLCAVHGEPNLAVLVVNKSTREPTKYADRADYWQSEQQRCLQRDWSSQASG